MQAAEITANYYYRLRRLRQAIPDYSAEENSNRKQIPDFVELPVPVGCSSPATHREQTMPEKSVASSVVRENNGITIIFSHNEVFIFQ